MPGQHVIHHTAQRKEIAGNGYGLTTRLFWRHIVWCAGDDSCPSKRRVVDGPGHLVAFLFERYVDPIYRA